jgi:hypothetical protein
VVVLRHLNLGEVAGARPTGAQLEGVGSGVVGVLEHVVVRRRLNVDRGHQAELTRYGRTVDAEVSHRSADLALLQRNAIHPDARSEYREHRTTARHLPRSLRKSAGRAPQPAIGRVLASEISSDSGLRHLERNGRARRFDADVPRFVRVIA